MLFRSTNGFQANIPTYTFWYDDYTGIGHPANQQINILISATEVAKFTYSGLLVNNLAGSGNRAVYSDSSGYLTNTSSDISLKTNINQLSDSLNKTKQLRGVSFNWKNTVKMGEQTEIGFIAQEVQDIVPEVIGGGKVFLRNVIDNIRAVQSPLSGRINADTVLIRIIK